MHRLLNKFTATLVLTIALSAATYWVYRQNEGESAGASAHFCKVKKGDLEQRITIAGTVESKRFTVLAAPYKGYIRKVHVNVGDHVKKGDPLISIATSLESLEPVYPMRSPINGVVSQVRKREGEYVSDWDSKEFILRVDDLEQYYVNAKSPEVERVKLKSGQSAQIKVTALLDKTFAGMVREISLSAEKKDIQFGFGKSTVEYPVNIEFVDKDTRIKPGMSAIIDVIAQKKTGVLVLGHEYIHEENNQKFVILKNGVRRDITVGLQNEMAAEIVKGLKEGDDVHIIEFGNE